MVDYEIYDVIDYKVLENYTVWVKFDDETERVIDFEPILSGPMFGPLRDRYLFCQVELDQEIGTLVWPTGADIDPTVLHDWPAHVEAIVKRRQQQFAVTA
jgi:Protein of unknown function (DUF2442)